MKVRNKKAQRRWIERLKTFLSLRQLQSRLATMSRGTKIVTSGILSVALVVILWLAMAPTILPTLPDSLQRTLAPISPTASVQSNPAQIINTVPITKLLDLADSGQIADATIAGNLVTATSKTGVVFRSLKEDGQQLTDSLRRSGVEVNVSLNAPEGVIGSPFVALLAVAAVIFIFFLVSKRGGLNSQALSFGKSSARMMDGGLTGVTFSDVAGVDEAKVELGEIVEFLQHPEKFRVLGARTPKGVLLVGPPGTGKTLISKAVAGEAGVPFFSISGSEFVEMYVGVGAARVRDLFKQARKNAPCIIFIDEIDAVGRQRGSSVGGNDEREQTLNQLLVEMDGFDSGLGNVVIAATNRPDILDQALLRPGRFDRRVMLDAPDITGRLAILEVHARNKPVEKEIDLRTIARRTPGFSGADLENLMNESAILAVRAGKNSIGRIEIDEGILRVVAGPERKSRVMTDYDKNIIAYHEVGHALVMKTLEHSNSVEKVSIIARGQALGITMQVPTDDGFLTSRTQLRSQMAALLGGRVAEELVFGDITTGARQDLTQVGDIARKMVVEFGMSELGFVPSSRRDEPGFGPGYSEDMASQVDAEVKRLVEEAGLLARRVLTERHDTMVAIAEHLKEVETLDGEDLDVFLGPDWKLINPNERIVSTPVALV